MIGALSLLAVLVGWHPIHSTTLILRETGTEVVGELRAFVEDFPPGSRDEAAIAHYLQSRLGITTGERTPIQWQYRSHRLDGGVLVVDLRLATNTVHGAILTNQLMEEKFADQVNVVAVERQGRRNTVVFLPHQGPQTLP